MTLLSHLQRSPFTGDQQNKTRLPGLCLADHQLYIDLRAPNPAMHSAASGLSESAGVGNKTEEVGSNSSLRSDFSLFQTLLLSFEPVQDQIATASSKEGKKATAP